MTQDEVLKELHNVIASNQQFTTWTVSTPHLVELVNRAVKAERERFIEICNHQADFATDPLDKKLLLQLRDAVRARGEQA